MSGQKNANKTLVQEMFGCDPRQEDTLFEEVPQEVRVEENFEEFIQEMAVKEDGAKGNGKNDLNMEEQHNDDDFLPPRQSKTRQLIQKHRRTNGNDEMMFGTLEKGIKREEHTNELFGHYIGSSLSELSPLSCERAKAKIQKILTEEKIKNFGSIN